MRFEKREGRCAEFARDHAVAPGDVFPQTVRLVAGRAMSEPGEGYVRTVALAAQVQTAFGRGAWLPAKAKLVRCCLPMKAMRLKAKAKAVWSSTPPGPPKFARSMAITREL